MIFPFLLALFALLFSTSIFPFLRLLVFTPFFAIAFQKKTFLQSLWIAALCGLLVDLMSSNTRFGLYSLSHVICAGATYRFRRHFFEESILSIPLYTGLISFTLSLIQTLLIYPSLFFSLFFTSCLLMPLADVAYAFFWFTCPLMVYHTVRLWIFSLLPKKRP
ncbi:MAG: hypothetical protein K1000chlam2_00730 [Chlamydiae bacterium]|nr:hypothetical protein [Chlamydiota bacterium]